MNCLLCNKDLHRKMLIEMFCMDCRKIIYKKERGLIAIARELIALRKQVHQKEKYERYLDNKYM